MASIRKIAPSDVGFDECLGVIEAALRAKYLSD
jgi:hypothetical protein